MGGHRNRSVTLRCCRLADHLNPWCADCSLEVVRRQLARLPSGATVPNEAALGVSSSYFLVSVRARQGGTLAQARALLRRDGREWPIVVWQILE